MLEVQQLNFAYGGVQALTDVSMRFQPARMTCVMGRNGVGKTTLMRNLIGLLKAESGAVTMDGKNLSKFSANKRAKAGIGYVPQGRMIFPKLSVEENLKVGQQAGATRKKSAFDEVYETFPILKEFRKRRGGDLSGGQQQQLAIGRAMISQPKVMILDEPTEGIQPNIIQQIGHVLHRLIDEKKMTIVLVEQYLDFVKEFGHDFYIMNRGRVVAEGETAGLTPELIREHLSV